MKWINEPPIKIVDRSDFENLARRFITSHNDMMKKEHRNGATKKDWEAWEANLEGRNNQADVYKQEGEKVAYLVSGFPAALMVVNIRDKDVRIEHIAAHVQVWGAAEVMIEWAVNYSVKKGKGGVLTLFNAAKTASGGISGVYSKMGFDTVSGQEQEMCLNPARSDKWVNLHTWKLKRYPTSSYLAQDT